MDTQRTKYRLLKDMPHVAAGKVAIKHRPGMCYSIEDTRGGTAVLSTWVVENNPEWFEKVEENIKPWTWEDDLNAIKDFLKITRQSSPTLYATIHFTGGSTQAIDKPTYTMLSDAFDKKQRILTVDGDVWVMGNICRISLLK